MYIIRVLYVVTRENTMINVIQLIESNNEKLCTRVKFSQYPTKLKTVSSNDVTIRNF